MIKDQCWLIAIFVLKWQNYIMKKKLDVSLIIGIAIPIVMVIFVATAIYLPRFFQSPEHNFIYADRGFDLAYYVNNSQLTSHCEEKNNDQVYYKCDIPANLYIYNVKENKSDKISFEDAKKLKFSTNYVSSDGYEVIRGGGGDILTSFFGGGRYDYNSWYIKGHAISKKIDLNYGNNDRYSTSFISWIEE